MTATLIQILILGFVQGAAELLPVSSSAHVVVAENDLVATRTAHPFNHGIVIEGVGEDQTIGH